MAAELSPDFRLEFTEGLIGFLGEQYPGLTINERAHATGVIVNTLAAFAANNSMLTTTPETAEEVVELLSDGALETVRMMVVDDEATSLLMSRSSQMAGVMKAVFEQ